MSNYLSQNQAILFVFWYTLIVRFATEKHRIFRGGGCMGSTEIREVLADTNKAVKNGVQFFFCNTNRGLEEGVFNYLEKKMEKQKYAAAWERFNFPSHMNKVKKHDVIFMYAKGVGFIGVGQASGPVKKLEPQQSGRLRKTWPDREWRIKMEEWFAWLPDEDAIRWPSKTLYRSKTFFDLTDEEHEDVRIAVSKAFLRIGNPVNA